MKSFFILFILSNLINIGAFANNIKLKVVYYHTPPHFNKGSKAPTGAGVEYTKMLLKRLGKEIEWVHVPIDRANSIRANYDYDLQIPIYINKKRLKKFKFGKVPIITFKHGFAFLKKRKILLKNILANKYTITHLKNFRVPEKLSHLKFNTLTGKSGNKRLLKLLEGGRVDVIYVGSTKSLEIELLRKNKMKNISIIETGDSGTSFYYPFNKKISDHFITKFDQELVKLKKELKYFDLLKKN